MLPTETSVDRCYMRELDNCEGSISGEHLISQAVIEVLRGHGNFTVSGLPWQEAGEEKRLAPGNLTANCLCRRHNSALSPLDSAAGLFFSGLRECMEGEIAPIPYLFSGHDVERWLLKTMKVMAVSRNLARGRVRLPGTFQRDIDVIELLDHPEAWPPAAGLYFIMPIGARFVNDPKFRLQPWFDDAQEEIVGLWASFIGLEFVMIIAAPNLSASPSFKRWLYRPSGVEMSIGSSRRFIELSWEDGLIHTPIKFVFETPVNR